MEVFDLTTCIHCCWNIILMCCSSFMPSISYIYISVGFSANRHELYCGSRQAVQVRSIWAKINHRKWMETHSIASLIKQGGDLSNKIRRPLRQQIPDFIKVRRDFHHLHWNRCHQMAPILGYLTRWLPRMANSDRSTYDINPMWRQPPDHIWRWTSSIENRNYFCPADGNKEAGMLLYWPVFGGNDKWGHTAISVLSLIPLLLCKWNLCQKS